MMDAFACIGRTAEARGLLDLAASHGLAPDASLFNAALRCCQDDAEMEQVRRLMAAAGVEGNRATVKLLERADLSRTYETYRFTRGHDRGPRASGSGTLDRGGSGGSESGGGVDD